MRPLFPTRVSLSSVIHLLISLPYNLLLSFCSIEDILAESDSDLSEDEGKGQKKTGKQKKGRAWLREGVEDDPLNFLDPKVSQRVLGKRLSNFPFDSRCQPPC